MHRSGPQQAGDGVPAGVLLAVDFGRRRIGLARSDANGVTASPVGHIERTTDEEAAKVVAAVAQRERAVAIVLGIPYHADGSRAPGTTIARNFATTLRRACPLPVVECDERHTSEEAEDLLRRQGRWPAAPGQLDAASAAVLLRRYLSGER